MENEEFIHSVVSVFLDEVPEKNLSILETAN